MANRIQLRRGTASQWTTANPTLTAGEAGFETDSGRIKFGDGTTAWTALAYYGETIAATAVTNDYTLVRRDGGKVIEANKATSLTVTIPPETSVPWPAGTILEVFQKGAGQVTIAAGSGVTLQAPFGAKTAVQYATVGLRKTAADTWVVSGDTTT